MFETRWSSSRAASRCPRRLPATVLALLVALAGSLVPATGGAVQKPTESAEQQLKFGIKMAQRGLWSEARFRFLRAKELGPGDEAVLNNLAVASEALGLFDEALGYYRAALQIDPNNKNLRQNYARFVEFYQSFRPEEPAAADEEETAAEDDETPGETVGGGARQ